MNKKNLSLLLFLIALIGNFTVAYAFAPLAEYKNYVEFKKAINLFIIMIVILIVLLTLLIIIKKSLKNKNMKRNKVILAIVIILIVATIGVLIFWVSKCIENYDEYKKYITITSDPRAPKF